MPVVMVTCETAKERVAEAAESEVDAYIVKKNNLENAEKWLKKAIKMNGRDVFALKLVKQSNARPLWPVRRGAAGRSHLPR